MAALWCCLRCKATEGRSIADRKLCRDCLEDITAAGRKRCRTCNRFVSLSLFCAYKASPDGKGYHCRPCRVANVRQWKRRNPEKVKAHRKARWEADIEGARAAERARQAKIIERRRAQHRASAARHREEHRVARRRYYERERESELAKQKAYHAANKERINQRKREKYQERKLAVLREIQQKAER